MAIVIIGASVAGIGVTAFAADPAPFNFLGSVAAPPANFGSDVTVASRVSFDPASTVTFTGGTNSTAEITSDRAVLNFAANDFNKVTISGIKIHNHGSTNTIASLQVSAITDFLIDARSPPSSTDPLRVIGPNEFAVPIDGAIGGTPGEAEVQLELMYWNSTAFVSADGKRFEPELWSMMLGNIGNLVFNFKDAYAANGTLTVHKFFDDDQDGIQDAGEIDLSGWTIEVYDSVGTTLVTSGVTDASGNVSFSLNETSYIVREVFPSLPVGCEGGQWIQTFPGGPDFEHSLTLTSGGATLEFGNALQCLTTIFKFFDEDGDGVHDLGEGGLQAWKVQIYDNTGTVLIDEDFTDSTGTATFTLEQGLSYIAREVLATDTSCANVGQWIQTFPGPPSNEHSFTVPIDGGVNLKFGNEQDCLTGVYVIELRLSSLD